MSDGFCFSDIIVMVTSVIKTADFYINK